MIWYVCFVEDDAITLFCLYIQPDMRPPIHRHMSEVYSTYCCLFIMDMIQNMKIVSYSSSSNCSVIVVVVTVV